jgi:hypothetical protein
LELTFDGKRLWRALIRRFAPPFSASGRRDSPFPVSRETGDRLAAYVDLIARWRKTANLIPESTFRSVWTRTAGGIPSPACARLRERWREAPDEGSRRKGALFTLNFLSRN